MKNFINKVANSRKLSSVIAYTGFALSSLFNVIALSAVFYNGMRKGVDVMEEKNYQEELKRWEEDGRKERD